MRRAVFIDRDGTINEDLGYVFLAKDFHLLPGSIEALSKLNKFGITIFIITNQSGIAKGFYTEIDFHSLTSYMLNIFRTNGIHIAEVLYCPHHPEGIVEPFNKKCRCRKPATGLLHDVIEKYDFQKEHLAMIGDKNSDIDAGYEVGMRTYLVQTGYGQLHKETTRATYIATDLKAAVDHLLQDWIKC